MVSACALRVALLPHVARVLQWYPAAEEEACAEYMLGHGNSMDYSPKQWDRMMRHAVQRLAAVNDAHLLLAVCTPVKSRQLKRASEEDGFPAESIGFWARLTSCVPSRPKEDEWFVDPSFLAHSMAYGASDEFKARLRTIEAEGCLMLVSARLASTCRAWRAEVNAWMPVAERKARLYRLSRARWLAIGDLEYYRTAMAFESSASLSSAVAQIQIGQALALPPPPPLPLVGESGELEKLDEALAADPRISRWLKL